jgi:hypothetical protein
VAFNKKQYKPQLGNIYAVNAGTYMGEFLVLVEESDQYIFLSLPDFHIRHVPREKYQLGIENKILDFREKLPEDVFVQCISKYNELKAGNIT